MRLPISDLLQSVIKRLPLRNLARVLNILFSRYPRNAFIVVFTLFAASILEGIGILTLLPLLNIATGTTKSTNVIANSLTGFLAEYGFTTTLALLLGFMVVTVLLKSLLMSVGLTYVGHSMARVQTDLRLDFIRSVLAARWNYFTSQPAGRLTTAVSGEPERAASAIFYGAQLLVIFIQGAVYIGAAFLVSPLVSLGAIVTGFGMIYVLAWYTRMARSAGESQTRFLNNLLNRFVDAIQGIKPIKAMALEKRFIPLLEQETAGLTKALQQQVVANNAVRAFQEPVATIVMAIGLFICLTVLAVPIVDVMVLGLLFWRSVQTLGSFQKIAQSMVVGESGLWSLLDATQHARNEAEEITGQPPPPLDRDITFDRVSFRYGASPVLNALSLEIPANHITAVVGPSGTGKTTVADLVIGLYRPDSGDIKIDGVSLSTINLHTWRETIGYVPQDTTLFAGDVLANVTLNDPAFGEIEAEAALRDAGAWDFVAAMPNGLHTSVGERGQHMSGGQRQRISLARALIRKPRLLVLDESTTALDPETEAGICQTLRELSRKITILAISHQAAIVQIAERVYRIENGHAVIEERTNTLENV